MIAALYVNGKIVVGVHHGDAYAKLTPEEKDDPLSGFIDEKSHLFISTEIVFSFQPCENWHMHGPPFCKNEILNRINNLISKDIPKIQPPTKEDINKVKYQILKELAYRYWQADNCPQGKDQEHWFKAEKDFQELL